MPIYEYKCENGHVFEVLRSMSEDPVKVCQTCDAPVQQVFHPIAIHFKGSGFHNTDYGTRNRSKELEKSAKDGADSHDKKSEDKKQEPGSKGAKDAKDSKESKTSKASSGDAKGGGSTSTS
ncbi:MAG: FmdB family zinc ribbon protein [Solirubrobacteraceae bacterium]